MFVRIATKLNNKKNKNKKKKRISPSVVAAIGTVIIIIGGFFLSYNYVQSKKMMAYSYINNVFYASGSDATNEEEEETINNNGDTEIPNVSDYQYIGYLQIPKINIDRGFYKKESELNDVDKNILVVKESDYPNVSKGNLIIAGHSGTGWQAFFNDLYKLDVGDEAKVVFGNKTYTYKFVNIYKAAKTGTISIYRNPKRTTLTLVTCTNFDNTTQTIYIAELEKIE